MMTRRKTLSNQSINPLKLLIFIYYFNGAVDMQICALLTRSQCKVSDTQVTVKACGPLVIETCPCSRAFGSGAVTT